jgi:hypothetical protein
VDGSSKDGKIVSGCRKFQGEEADKCARVGREEEDTNSNRPELGGFVLALQSAALSEDVLLQAESYAIKNNEALQYAIKKWVGQGSLGKATLATAPDAEILLEVICLLTQRVRAVFLPRSLALLCFDRGIKRKIPSKTVFTTP